MGHQIRIFALDSRYKNLIRSTEKDVEVIFKLLKKKSLEVEVYFVSSLAMRSLNWRFNKKNKATNVLSFEAIDRPDFYEYKKNGKIKLKSIGEIYLCISYIEKNKEDLKKMVAHGCLHLLGFDHKKLKDAWQMEKMEDKILKHLYKRE